MGGECCGTPRAPPTAPPSSSQPQALWQPLFLSLNALSLPHLCPALRPSFPLQLVSTMVHELTHALGFSPELWDPSGTANGPSLFISASGATLPASKVVATLPADPNQGPGSRPAVATIVTPTVVAEVRSHFGCPTLPGAALEDLGGAGSAGSHWEYELFQVCWFGVWGAWESVGMVGAVG